MRATLFPETISPMTSGKKKSPETLRSYRWLGPDNLRAFGHRSRLRQLGYDRADWAGKPKIISGLGLGDGWVAVVLGVIIVAMVAYLGLSGRDVQTHDPARAGRAAGPQ